MSQNPLTGTVTFLFTDLEGSTRLWEAHPQAMQSALARHDEILKAAVVDNSGQVIKTTGDGIHAVFPSPTSAADAAIVAQRNMLGEQWEQTGPLKVRMGIHTGEAHYRDGDYYGSTLNRAARIMSIGHGGQILTSETSLSILRDNLSDEFMVKDLGAHRLKDISEPEHVFQISRSPLPADFPPLSSQNIIPNNLPHQLTNFVGRARELADIEGRLTNTRLLTLVGVGGTGKTRLSLQLGEIVLPQYQDGVWFIDLASLTDPEQIYKKVANSIGVNERPGFSIEETLKDYLRNKHVVIILDNCEHLIAACAEIAEFLLQNCPQLKIIATSREGLAVVGETLYQVPSLGVPASTGGSLEEMMDIEAVQLFANRAQAVSAEFALSDDNIEDVIKICRRLDGIPLAIELAAARVNMLAVDQIAVRLDDRFRLLSSGSRTAMPRQQTLHALIDWSWQLLTEEEQRLLRRLSVFVGGWTLDAAEAVAKITGQLDVFTGLTQLVHKSLVIVDQESIRVRYRLLESVRLYAFEKLLEADEIKEIRDQHTAYYIDLYQAAQMGLGTKDMIAWGHRYTEDVNNIRAAVEWALSENHEYAFQLGRTAIGSPTQMIVVSPREMLGWFRQVEKLLLETDHFRERQDYPLALVRTYVALSACEVAFGHNRISHDLAEKAIELGKQYGLETESLVAFSVKHNTNIYLHLTEDHQSTINQAIELARNNQLLDKEAIVLALAGISYSNSGKYDLLAEIIDEFGEVAQLVENPWIKATYAQVYGRHLANQGELETARSYIDQSVSLYSEVGDIVWVQLAQINFAHFLRSKGEWPEAEEIYRETTPRLLIQGANPGGICYQLECFAFIANEKEQFSKAAQLLAAAKVLRVENNSTRALHEEREFEAAMTLVQSKLSDDQLAAAQRAGQRMTLEQAVEFALVEPSES